MSDSCNSAMRLQEPMERPSSFDLFCWFCRAAAQMHTVFSNKKRLNDEKQSNGFPNMVLTILDVIYQTQWARQNQQNDMCAQWRHRSACTPMQSKTHWVLSHPQTAQRRLWSDWAEARLILVFAGRTGHFIGLFVLDLPDKTLYENPRSQKLPKQWKDLQGVTQSKSASLLQHQEKEHKK